MWSSSVTNAAGGGIGRADVGLHGYERHVFIKIQAKSSRLSTAFSRRTFWTEGRSQWPISSPGCSCSLSGGA